MRILQLGLLSYRDALLLMEDLHGAVVADSSLEDILLVVEHPPVVTMGLRERSLDLLTAESRLAEQSVEFYRIDRGGSVTVHEPGQLVLYPIVRVDARLLTVRKLVWALEEAMIFECARWGLQAARDSINPGVWIGQDKVGAVGVRVANHVSKHGLALNVSNSLATFSHIVPCGIHGRGVTSIALSRQKIAAQHQHPSVVHSPSAATQQSPNLSGEEPLLEMSLPTIGARVSADLKNLLEGFRAGKS